MDSSRFRVAVALAFGAALAGPALAQQRPASPQAQPPQAQPPSQPSGAAQQGQPPSQSDEEETPTPAALTVGSMAIAADAALSVEAMAVDVTIDRITYGYKFRNRSKTKLTLAASVALPDLEVNNEGTTVYQLPSSNAENVVGLEVKANGQPVATKAYVQAVALGIDRLAELKAENIPLIPFGEELDKALGGVKPESLGKLQSLGLVTPRDPAQPDTPVIADWSLHVVHGWMQPLEPNVTTDVAVAFTPVKAVYTIDAGSLDGFDALKEQVCVTPQVVNGVRAMLKDKGATAAVADITLSNDGPARWLENPPGTVSIHKPTPDSIIVFCGMDATTQGKEIITGKMPTNSEAENLRILIFARNDGR